MEDNRTRHDPVVDLGHRPHLDPQVSSVPASTLPVPHHTESAAGSPVDGSKLSLEELDQLTADIVTALKSVYDPEIPSDIYELGLIYKIDIDDDRICSIDMTLTAPGCPVAGEMPGWVADAVEPLPGVKQVNVQMTFDPPWGMDMMSDEAKLELGFM
jgi:FeS assembly SUF system protein